MRKITAVLLFLLILSSCSLPENRELNERFIIEAIGIDGAENGFNVTIEGLDSTGAENDPDSKFTKCYVFRSSTVEEAMNSVSRRTGLSPLFSQSRVLLLGMETAETKLSEVLDFFSREYKTRTDIPIAVARDSAENIITADYGENTSAGRLIREAMESYKDTGASVFTPLYKFINSAVNETDAAVCPVIENSVNSTDGLFQIEINSTAVFGKSGNIFLDGNQTSSFLLLSGKGEKGVAETETEKGTASLKIIKASPSVKTTVENGKVLFRISCSVICDIAEFRREDFSPADRDEIKKLSGLTAEKITGEIAEIIDYAYFENCCDILGFGRRINLADRDFYRQYRENPRAFYGDISFIITTAVTIRRTGKTVLSA